MNPTAWAMTTRWLREPLTPSWSSKASQDPLIPWDTPVGTLCTETSTLSHKNPRDLLGVLQIP